jgi:hypothetical protein
MIERGSYINCIIEHDCGCLEVTRVCWVFGLWLDLDTFIRVFLHLSSFLDKLFNFGKGQLSDFIYEVT